MHQKKSWHTDLWWWLISKLDLDQRGSGEWGVTHIYHLPFFCRRTFQGCFQLVPCKPIDPRSFDVAWWVKSPGFVACFWKTFLPRATILVMHNDGLSLPNFAPLCPPLMCQSCTFFCPLFLLDIFFCELATCRFVPTTLLSAWNEVRSCRGVHGFLRGAVLKHLPVVEWSETG